jgi:pimeloyl-ACP methyl ester carboxylesterase
MSAIILGGEIVHYEVLGRGRPLIFLHGWIGSWRYWIPSMQSASIACRAYALDFWGFGDSARHPEYYSLARQCQLIEEFLNKMGINKCALIGHGLGASVATLLASRIADRIDRVMAISLPNLTEMLSPRLLSEPIEILVEWLFDHNPNYQAARNDAIKTDPRALQLAVSQAQELAFDRIITNLQVPFLWLNGKNDMVLIQSQVEPLRDHSEKNHYIRFEESGYFPMLDEPSKFNRLLADFLTFDSTQNLRQLQVKEEWKRRIR